MLPFLPDGIYLHSIIEHSIISGSRDEDQSSRDENLAKSIQRRNGECHLSSFINRWEFEHCETQLVPPGFSSQAVYRPLPLYPI